MQLNGSASAGRKALGREFEVEDDGRRIGRLDLVDHQVIAGARAQHALRRKDDLVPARGDVGGGQRRAVGEFDAVADLEGVGLAVVGRLRHLGAQIADDIGRRGRIVRVDANQARCRTARSRAPSRRCSRGARRSSAARRPGSYRSECRRVSALPRPRPRPPRLPPGPGSRPMPPSSNVVPDRHPSPSR